MSHTDAAIFIIYFHFLLTNQMISTFHNIDGSQTQHLETLPRLISIFWPQESIKTLFWSHTDVFNELHFSPEICTFQSNFFHRSCMLRYLHVSEMIFSVIYTIFLKKSPKTENVTHWRFSKMSKISENLHIPLSQINS